MRRSAFSLIELIFVIILLGILSAFSVVKLGEMATTAQVTRLQSFVGTLNRSVSGAIWFDSMQNSRDRSVAYADYDAQLDNYITILPESTFGPSFINCNSTGDGVFLSYSYEKNYEIHCKDGNETSAPSFQLYNLTDNLYVN